MPGQATYPDLVGGSFVFQAKASIDGGVTFGPPTPEFAWQVLDCSTTMTLCKVTAPDSYTPVTGATFNNPVADSPAQRRNLTHVIRTINSMPGYGVKDPAVCDPNNLPSTIRISLYSLTDMPVARALRMASRRCISVQVLMNNHLGPKHTPAVKYLEYYLGGRVTDPTTGLVRRSFAHRCAYGCRGGGVLHSKFYLFDSPLAVPGHSQITKTVMVGSSNMTANASKVQWNDLYTVRRRPDAAQPVPLHVRPDAARPGREADVHVRRRDLPVDVHPADPRQRRPDAGRAELHPLHRRRSRHRFRRADDRLHQHARVVRGARLRVRQPGPPALRLAAAT